MATEVDLFIGITFEHGGYDFELAAGAVAHGILVEAEVEGEGFAAGGVFDERGVIDIAARDAVRVIGEEAVEIDLRDEPRSGSGGLAEAEGEFGVLCPVCGNHVGKVSDRVAAGEHGAERFCGAHAVLSFFKKNAQRRDFRVGDCGRVHEIAGELEVLPEDGLEEGIGDTQRIGEDRLGDGFTGGGRQGKFLDHPLAAFVAEIKEDAVAAGFAFV